MHPHHRWHVDLQDMSVFKKSKISSTYNFMLVCVDDFSNYIMIKLLQNKRAKTIHDAIIDLMKSEGTIPTIIYCDQGSEFNNPQMNFFKVQFTIDRRKAVYAECAICTIRKSLEQLYMLCPTIDVSKAIQIVVTAHNSSPSGRNPILRNGIHASPKEVLKSDKLSEEMEKMV